jgi:hypothetical protein
MHEEKPGLAHPKRHLVEVEVALRFRVNRKTLQEWRRRRIGPPFIKLGTGPHARVRYPLTMLERWEEEQAVVTSPEVTSGMQAAGVVK